jgi:uncharacterized membrane protein YecN with MAPEG domain
MITLVTFKYAAILGIIFFALSSWVIAYRIKYKVLIGSNNILTLEKMIRTHANFAEYIPLCLILLTGFEIVSHNVSQTHVLGIMLVVGRILHMFGVNFRPAPNVYRILGVVLTFSVILYTSIVILKNL